MFWLIEDGDQLKRFCSKSYKEAFVEIIPYSYQEHPSQNKICAIYIRPLISTKGFILSIDHSETLHININDIISLLSKIDTIYIRDKKEFLHYLVLKNLYDITLTHPTYIQEFTQTHSWFKQKYPNKIDVNRIVPIVKHYEYCENMYDKIKDRINDPINEFYNTKCSVVFNAMERNGLRVNRTQFEHNFHSINSDYTYTQYNFKTLTTRPSNRFKGVNYAALNKDDGCRKTFIPRNDKLVEVDISAYHPTLLANLVGYEFGEEDVHAAFARMYGVDYKKSKELTFKQLYGGVFEQYKDLEFFSRVQVYIDDIWDKWLDRGYVECNISGYKFEKEKLDDMKPQKLLNYILQNLETATNVCILWDIFKILRDKNTKLVLYTYDSFLFDLDKTEKSTFKEILNTFKERKLQTKISYGDTYDFR